MMSPDSSELEHDSESQLVDDPDTKLAGEMQALLLERLRVLLDRRSNGSKLDMDQQRLLDRAIYSTFCDCLELGLSEPARSLLRQHQAS